ncbi:MAG TPA: NAD(P)H-hydrate dehydratase, partial [Gammaproteobacteria bacterium]|nr:NAD(P)H-hydrate dehydratase [Gammaproteobacteria bacterium]
LVSVVHSKGASARVMATAIPELMCYAKEPKQLPLLMKKATTIVCGPGLGQSRWAKASLNEVLQSTLPLVIDADGLNNLPKKIYKHNWILTPHPGEAAKLLGISTEEVQKDRLQTAKNLLSKFGGVIVLKGAGTLVVTEHELPWICTAGNAGMASGGMGDVLAGLIGGLVAQNMSLFNAARLGVLIHAMAGDLEEVMGQRGMIASDLFLHIRSLLNPSL